MKKAGYILAWLLEIAALAGAYIIHYFTRKKMGMARWVIYKNQGWEREYPMELLKNVSIAAIVVLTILILIWFLTKRKEVSNLTAAMVGFTIGMSALYIAYTLISSRETMRAYYFISLLFGIGALVQILKTIIGIATDKRGRNEK